MANQQLQILRKNALPPEASRVPNTMYFVPSATAGEMDLHFVGASNSVTKTLITRGAITTMINDSLSGQNSAQTVADIGDRDALVLTQSRFIMVADASADPDVSEGAAMYFYDHNSTNYTKIYEAEGMDLVLSWGKLSDKPTSTVEDIDEAVADSHTHDNAAVLNALGDTGGFPSYNGVLIGMTTAEPEW